MPHLGVKTVCDEIVDAFKDVPRPDRCTPKGHKSDYGFADLRHLSGKTWIEIASHVKYMAWHDEEHFFFMTKECLAYLLPGYLLGVLNHDWECVVRVTRSLLILLGRVGDDQLIRVGAAALMEDRIAYVRDRLTPEQKRAVAHWLELVLERDKEQAPQMYEKGEPPTLHQLVSDSWRRWQ